MEERGAALKGKESLGTHWAIADLNCRFLPCEGEFGFCRVIPFVAMMFVSLYETTNRFNHVLPPLSVHFRGFHVST